MSRDEGESKELYYSEFFPLFVLFCVEFEVVKKVSYFLPLIVDDNELEGKHYPLHSSPIDSVSHHHKDSCN